MELRPPADPCMCGAFSTWHACCYAGLPQVEIDRRHKAFVARWNRVARKRLAQRVLRRIDGSSKK